MVTTLVYTHINKRAAWDFGTICVITIQTSPMNQAEVSHNQKAVTTKTEDRISELPEDVLSFILSLLTLKDAVKLRVLSPRWRYLCPFTTNLHFDLFTVFGINYDQIYLRKHSDNLWEGKLKFVRAVDQILQLYRNQVIYSFKVFYCLGNESACDIDRWISFAVRKQTGKLDLDFSCIPRGRALYNFACHLLPRGKESRLKHLCLHACILRPSPDLTNRLNSLNTLDLNKVPLDQNVFDNILSGCANLKCLTLKGCRLPRPFLIHGPSICLERLVVENCLGAHIIELSSINLKTFECTHEDSIIVLRFNGVLSVDNLHLTFIKGTDNMFSGLAKDLPLLENLSLNLYTHRVWPVPANVTRFSHLKRLELIIYLSPDFDLLSVALILNASPCLQNFHLALQDVLEDRDSVKWEYSKQLYYQLREVEISGFYDICNSLGLAIYLLSSAVGLQRMVINSRSRYYIAAARWAYMHYSEMNESEKQRVLGVLLMEKLKSDVELVVL